MKKSLYILFFALMPLLAAGSLADGTRAGDEELILGNWKPSNGRSVVKVYRGAGGDEDANKFYGKIVWLKETKDADGNPRTDINNPEDDLKSKPLKGLVIIKDLEFVEVDGKVVTWGGDGTIYDPNNGSEYSFEANIDKKNKNVMNGRGYIGVSLFGRTDTWSRLVKK